MTTLEEKEFAEGNVQFAAKVYKDLLSSTPGNFLFCPLALQNILALLHAGAYNKSAVNLSNALHLPSNSEDIQETFKKFFSQLQTNEDYTLKSANKFYIKNDYKIKDEFKKTAIKSFNTKTENIDFKKREEAVSEMNKWIEERTRNKIKKLIQSDLLYKTTTSLIITPVNFCGKWEKVFYKYVTNKCPFYLNNETSLNIEMMKQKDYFRYYESSELDSKFVEMPYEGGEVSINFVLPNDKEGLSKLEDYIDDIFTTPKYSYYDVSVVIPKFEIETQIEFIPILQKLGIVNLFEANPDFSGIIENEAININAIIQKVFIEVDERGTTAPAAINCIMELPEDSCEIEPKPLPAEFIADHPFLFYIKFKDIILFLGRFTSTKSS